MAEALNLKDENQTGTRSGNGRGFKSLRARHNYPVYESEGELQLVQATMGYAETGR